MATQEVSYLSWVLQNGRYRLIEDPQLQQKVDSTLNQWKLDQVRAADLQVDSSERRKERMRRKAARNKHRKNLIQQLTADAASHPESFALVAHGYRKGLIVGLEAIRPKVIV